jgi:hypothetical protein
MIPLADRVASAVREDFPDAHCFSCLATRLAVTEDDVRNAAQALIMDGAFRVDRRVCHGCASTDAMLVKAADH